MATSQGSIKLYLPAADEDWLRSEAQRNGRTLTGELRWIITAYRRSIYAAAGGDSVAAAVPAQSTETRP